MEKLTKTIAETLAQAETGYVYDAERDLYAICQAFGWPTLAINVIAELVWMLQQERGKHENT